MFVFILNITNYCVKIINQYSNICWFFYFRNGRGDRRGGASIYNKLKKNLPSYLKSGKNTGLTGGKKHKIT